MTTSLEQSAEAVAVFDDTESLTVLVVAGVTRDQVAATLGVDLSRPVADVWDDEDTTGWALLEVPGGVLAVETTGFGDPSLADLIALSALSAQPAGGAAAVTRCNVLAHYRFGCARRGELIFDDNEYMYLDDPDTVPTELRPLFELVDDNLDDDADVTSDEGEGGDGDPDPLIVGLAMAELITGVEITADHVQALLEGDMFSAPRLRYPSPPEVPSSDSRGGSPGEGTPTQAADAGDDEGDDTSVRRCRVTRTA